MIKRRTYTKDPIQALNRRMSAYPPEMWEILQAAEQGRNTTMTFKAHNEAASFIVRWYRFRLDAIESNAPGHLGSRYITVRGLNSDGTLFNSRDRIAPGPFQITWHYNGPPPQVQAALADPVRELEKQRPVRNVGVRADDEFEKLLHKHMGIEAPMVEQGECAHEWDSLQTRCLKCNTPYKGSA